ncbi:MAG: PHP domain-containing protein [Clostridia bacterium]|nr:PHP domain-containing protein [Clostridia bacterium]
MLKKLVSVLVISALITGCVVSVPVFAQDAGGDYVISNPYQNIDWSTVKAYKTGLHNHTNASDGDPTLKESIERHLECGFDIVAITDHGTVNYTWETENPNKLIHSVLSLIGRNEGELVYLGNEGVFNNGISYTYSTAENGDDYLVCSNGKTIMRVPYGIEQNAVSANAHVNSWFADFHNNTIETYIDAVKNVDSLDGVCVINHPGEYTKARYEIHSADAYNDEEFNYWYHINKFASLIDRFGACIGIDINSKGDNRTRFDRILWDRLLNRFADNGENVYAICSSDAHQLDKIDTGFVYALMAEQSSSALKSCLSNGEFFGASHCIGNPDELEQIASAVKQFYGETETYTNIESVITEMKTRVEEIENGERDADDDIGIVYDVLDENGYFEGETQPMITGINIDEDADSITINTTDALLVRWISNGKLIATTKADEATLKLSDYSSDLGNYVRAEVFGEGGIVYTQAFLLNAEKNAGKSPVVDSGFIDFGKLDCLIGIFSNWKDIIDRTFKNLF